MDAVSAQADEHGERFTLDLPVQHEGRCAVVRSCWIVRAGERAPRLTSSVSDACPSPTRARPRRVPVPRRVSETDKNPRTLSASRHYYCVPRPHRLSTPLIAYHVTQRGNFRQDTFCHTSDPPFFLDQLQHAAAQEGCLIHAYCLMSNHFHLLVRPLAATSLSRTLQRASSSYSRFTNIRNHRYGHLWQARFYSSPIEETHLARVIRYIERNPLAAKITAKVEEWPWSSALARLKLRAPEPWLNLQEMPESRNPEQWRSYLLSPGLTRETAEIHRTLMREKPYGSAAFQRDFARTYSGVETQPNRRRPAASEREPEARVSNALVRRAT